MSNSETIVTGFVSKDPEVRSVTGHEITTVTVPVTPQKRNAQGDYEDSGETVWYQAEFWDEHGQVVAHQVRKGSQVILTGTLEVRLWESNGKAGVGVKLGFPTIALVIPRPKRGGNRAPAAVQDEPWATTAPGTPPSAGDPWNGAQAGAYGSTDDTPFG